MLALGLFSLLTIIIGGQEPLKIAPPPLPPAVYLPFPKLPDLALDEAVNGYGIAQKMTRARGLQGRLLWIDATANLDAVNSETKIIALVEKIASTGFNTIVFDVKPIIGQTLYPSKFAPKMTEWVRPWKTQSLPKEFDPLLVFTREAKKRRLSLIISVNAFSEGHREFPGAGLGDLHPEWQTVLYENKLTLKSPKSAFIISDRANLSDNTGLAVYTDSSKIPKNALFVKKNRE